jgi:hypothetical protein
VNRIGDALRAAQDPTYRTLRLRTDLAWLHVLKRWRLVDKFEYRLAYRRTLAASVQRPDN